MPNPTLSPAKRGATGVLFLDNRDRLLIVRPIKNCPWHIPGGSIEAHESPKDAGIREVKEELSLDLADLTFAGMNYFPATTEKDDWYLFLFSSQLDTNADEQIALAPDELAEYQLLPWEEAVKLLPEPLQTIVRNVLTHATQAGCYSELAS